MTEPKPTYIATVADRQRETQTPDVFTAYLWRRRDLLIAELREIDRLLGRAQTVPERVR